MMSKSQFVQVDNIVFDKIMGVLEPSEFAIFMVVYRKTVGWHKESDVISTSQFSKMANLSNKTVIKCINKLLKYELIVREPIAQSFRYQLNIFDENHNLKENSILKETNKDKKENCTCEEKSQVAYEDISPVADETYVNRSNDPMEKVHTQNKGNTFYLNTFIKNKSETENLSVSDQPEILKDEQKSKIDKSFKKITEIKKKKDNLEEKLNSTSIFQMKIKNIFPKKMLHPYEIDQISKIENEICPKNKVTEKNYFNIDYPEQWVDFCLKYAENEIKKGNKIPLKNILKFIDNFNKKNEYMKSVFREKKKNPGYSPKRKMNYSLSVEESYANL